MKDLIPYHRTLHEEFHRALCGNGFWMSVLIIFLWMNANTFNIWSDVPKEYINLLFHFPTALFNNMLFRAMLLPIATIPFAWSYIQDRESGFAVQIMTRVGRRAYVLGKTMSVAVTAFLAVLLGGILFVLGFYVMGGSSLPPYPIKSLTSYWEIGVEVGIFPYILTWLSVAGSAASLAAVFSLMTSAWLPNRFVSLLASLIGCYTWEVLNSIAWNVLPRSPFVEMILQLTNPVYLVMEQVIPDRPWVSLLWSCGFLLTLCIPCTVLFGKKIGKELAA